MVRQHPCSFSEFLDESSNEFRGVTVLDMINVERFDVNALRRDSSLLV